MGLVSQEPVLFACSIADNISYGKEDATREEVGGGGESEAFSTVLCAVESLQYSTLCMISCYEVSV